MARYPLPNTNKLLASGVGINSIRCALSPLSNYSRCESAAFVRRALTSAIHKNAGAVSPHRELVPSQKTVSLGASSHLSRDTLHAIESEKNIKKAAIEASAQLKKARYFFEQAQIVSEEIKPILYYYGGIYFLDFICLNLVRRDEGASRGHGLTVTTATEGWNFNRAWSDKSCWVEIESTGDFPFYVDALTVSGFPTLFSTFLLYKKLKSDPWKVKENLPQCLKKASLFRLCNFNKDTYLTDHPDVNNWFVETSKEQVWGLTSLLMDLIVVYIASQLARYYTPAWNKIIEAHKSDIYNDIRAAYGSVADGLPLFFEDKYPFRYSYETRIPPY